MRALVLVALFAAVLVTSARVHAQPAWVELNLLVENDARRPVEGASIRGLFYHAAATTTRSDRVLTNTTDGDGRAMIRGTGYIYVDVAVVKDGYYETTHRILVTDPAKLEAVDAHRIRLRQRIDPVSMLAKRVIFLLPGREAGGPYAFDFLRGDFVTPFGEGVERDIELSYVREFNSIRDFSWTLNIRFPNATDGLIPQMFDPMGSDFRSGYQAPASGYQTQWAVSKSRGDTQEPPKAIDDPNKQGFYFRVRTRLNDAGEVIGGHYGKIYGRFPKATYYVNPDVGERNVEWDGTNQFGDLPLMERAASP